VTVNCVLPGPTETENLKAFIKSVNPNSSYNEAERKFMAENRPSSLIYRLAKFEFVKLNAKEFDWRDAYHLILTLSWPEFAGLVFAGYLLVNLGFAGLYPLDPHGVAEMSSFFDAFFFSVDVVW
jgi:hypothetical protein